MVDPLSVSIGVGVAAAAVLVALGIIFLGRSPSYIVDMREIRNHQMQVQSSRAIEQDISDGDDA